MPTAAPPRGVKPFDFRRPEGLTKQQLRALAPVLDGAARRMSAELAGGLRCRVSLRTQPLRQESADVLAERLPHPALNLVFTMPPLPSRALMHIPTEVAFALIDLMLGGDALGPFPSRELTDIEHGLLGNLLQPALATVPPALTPGAGLGAVQPSVGDQMPELGGPGDGFVVATADIEISGFASGGTVTGIFTIALPITALRPVVDSLLAERSSNVAPGAAERAEQRLLTTPMPVALRFPAISVASRTLLSLAVGDLLPLGHSSREPLLLHVVDRPLMLATPIQSGRRLAAAITTTLGGQP